MSKYVSNNCSGSSAAEQITHNGQVVGSIPARSTKHKYASGNLFCVCFDEYGSRIGKATVKNYMDGRAKINQYIKKYPGRSCILERVVYNSKDGHKVSGAE